MRDGGGGRSILRFITAVELVRVPEGRIRHLPAHERNESTLAMAFESGSKRHGGCLVTVQCVSLLLTYL